MKNLGKRKSEKIKNNLKKGGGRYNISDFQEGKFYELELNKNRSVYYYLTKEGFFNTDTDNFANSITKKVLENEAGGLNAYIYLYNLYGDSGGYLEAVRLESITYLLMLQELNFQNLVLTGINDRKYNFHEANLQGAIFINADFENVKFNGAVLQNANFENATLNKLSFFEAQLQNANFENAQLDGVEFSDALLQNANFENAELDGVDFSNALLQNAKFMQVKITGDMNVFFTKANLTNAKIELLQEEDYISIDVFKEAILEKADLRNTMLESANLQGVNLKEANLQGVNLRNAELERADLTGAKLEGADLTGAKLEGAIIFGAIFTNAIINQELRKAINNRKPLIKSNDFIRIPVTNNIHRRNKIAIPNNSSPNAIDYRNTLEKLANELYKHKILPLDKTEIIDKSVIHLLQTNYTESNKIHSHIKDAIKVVRIFLLRIQFQKLEQKIMSNNF
jgi:uncharacterized protein YjbI with pentapeptide repeats